MIFDGLHWPKSEKSKKPKDYQIEQRQIAIDACKKKDCAIDGGAHVGIWTTHLLKEFKEVIAFEPIPEIYDCLSRNAPTAKIYNNALGDSEKLVKIGYWPDRTFHSHIDDKGIDVRMVQLDSFDFHPDLIKLDVEGCEYAAIMGAKGMINKYHPVMCIEQKHSYNSKQFDALNYLKDIGYKVISNIKHDYILTWG